MSESLSVHMKLNFFVDIDMCGMDFILVGTEKDDISACQYVLRIKSSMKMLVILH